ncbi:hypothetical protein GSF70_11980 [Flavobacteriaceae bacterium W22]|nr:hypothetical protein [Flavobacteriaceae bacterium W22]
MKKKDFDCEAERELISKEKLGEIIYLPNKNKFEIFLSIKIRNHINAENYVKIINDPIPDDMYELDASRFGIKLPNIESNLFIYYELYEKLVNNYIQRGFDFVNISFLQMEQNQFEIEDISQEDLSSLNSFVNKIYAIVTFSDKQQNKDETFLLFNMKDEYPINIDLDKCHNDFLQSCLGQSMKNSSKDKYVPSYIQYELPKVKKYIDRVRNYLNGCLNKDVDKIAFNFCFGLRKHKHVEVESFYLSSIPIDITGQYLNLNFPYYDQGSLEP